MLVVGPRLTQLPLYEDKTAIDLRVHGQDLFLTQCVGYYLEAAVHGLERVYNIGSSFRAEDSKSPRHLVEYWHVKVEVAWCNINSIIEFSERLVTAASEYVATHCRDLAADMKTNLTPVPSRPFDQISYRPDFISARFHIGQISYREIIQQIRRAGGDVKFGDHIGPKEEALLWEFFDRPF
jgi:asparaginyl-tRNA synthetase